MAFFAIVLILPLLVGLVGFIFLDGINWKEMLVQFGAQLLVAGVSAFIVYHSATADTEIWSGTVVSKDSDHVSCSHSYQCNCHESCSGSGKNRSCSTVCDTCYEHLYDVNWEVWTSNQERVLINRVDRQGVRTPARWAAVQMGEPTAVEHDYTNYIKAAPDTLFRHQGLVEKYKGKLPAYPGGIYDYYHLDRLVTRGVEVSGRRAWNADLSSLNAYLGTLKQTNMIVVLVQDQPQDYFYALEQAWMGGKKNDIVLVIDVDAQMAPQWASVMAWTTQEIFKVRLRDAVMDDKVITRESVIEALREVVPRDYKRKPMKDFAYLKSSITPSTTGWIVSLVIGLLVAGGLTYLFQVHDIFGVGDSPTIGLSGRRRSRRKPSWR